MFTCGSVLYIHNFVNEFTIMRYGFITIIYTMFTWWRDIIREATFEDCHSITVRRGLRLGMVLCALLSFNILFYDLLVISAYILY